MRIVPAHFSLAALFLALFSACKAAAPQQIEYVPSSPTSSTAIRRLRAPVHRRRHRRRCRRVPRSTDPARAPIAVPVPARSRQARFSSPNRDKHGPADIAQYIQNLQSDARVTELKVDVVLSKLAAARRRDGGRPRLRSGDLHDGVREGVSERRRVRVATSSRRSST